MGDYLRYYDWHPIRPIEPTQTIQTLTSDNPRRHPHKPTPDSPKNDHFKNILHEKLATPANK